MVPGLKNHIHYWSLDKQNYIPMTDSAHLFNLTYSTQTFIYITGISAWMKITFPGFYHVNYSRIMQRFKAGEQFKDIQLIFDNSVTVEVNVLLITLRQKKNELM